LDTHSVRKTEPLRFAHVEAVMNQHSTGAIAPAPAPGAPAGIADVAFGRTTERSSTTKRPPDAIDRLIELANMLDPETWLAQLAARQRG
jgi:hypothetical protein